MPSKDIKDLVKRLKEQGWTVVVGGSGHLKCYPPDSKLPVTIPSTPGDHRSLKNTERDLVKRGYVPPPRGGGR